MENVEDKKTPETARRDDDQTHNQPRKQDGVETSIGQEGIERNNDNRSDAKSL